MANIHPLATSQNNGNQHKHRLYTQHKHCCHGNCSLMDNLRVTQQMNQQVYQKDSHHQRANQQLRDHLQYRPAAKSAMPKEASAPRKTAQRVQHQVLQSRRSPHREVHRKNRAEVAVAQPATTTMISTHHVAVAEAEGDKMLI